MLDSLVVGDSLDGEGYVPGLGLGVPDGDGGGGADDGHVAGADEASSLESLDGLAEPHLVGQEVAFPPAGQPGCAHTLIGVQSKHGGMISPENGGVKMRKKETREQWINRMLTLRVRSIPLPLPGARRTDEVEQTSRTKKRDGGKGDT